MLAEFEAVELLRRADYQMRTILMWAISSSRYGELGRDKPKLIETFQILLGGNVIPSPGHRSSPLDRKAHKLLAASALSPVRNHPPMEAVRYLVSGAMSCVTGDLLGQAHDMMGCLIKIIDILIDALLFDHEDCRAQSKDLIQFIAVERSKVLHVQATLTWHVVRDSSDVETLGVCHCKSSHQRAAPDSVCCGRTKSAIVLAVYLPPSPVAQLEATPS